MNMKNNTKETKTFIISVVNLKGGVGRSTLSTNLAGELAKTAQVLLIDADTPQSTASSWFALRSDSGRSEGLALMEARTAEELVTILSSRAERFIVIDSPPRLAGLARAMMMMADLVLVPVATSAAEVWATGDFAALLKEAAERREIDARLVWSRHRGNTKLAREITSLASEALGIKALNSHLSLRVAYQEALGTGKTGTEVGDSAAREEVRQLTEEVIKLLEKKR